MTIGIGITGSFCTHAKILEEIQLLVDKGYDVVPIITESVASTNTRFGLAKDFIKKLEETTKNKVVQNIVQAEPLGPSGKLDVLLIAPCTGNTLAKLANAITDNAVLMTAKSLMRNNKPIVIGLSTNDALGLNLQNIGKLITVKNVYFVPFGQDDYEKKPKSLIAKWLKIEETILHAMKGEQIQPII